MALLSWLWPATVALLSMLMNPNLHRCSSITCLVLYDPFLQSRHGHGVTGPLATLNACLRKSSAIACHFLECAPFFCHLSYIAFRLSTILEAKPPTKIHRIVATRGLDELRWQQRTLLGKALNPPQNGGGLMRFVTCPMIRTKFWQYNPAVLRTHACSWCDGEQQGYAVEISFGSSDTYTNHMRPPPFSGCPNTWTIPEPRTSQVILCLDRMKLYNPCIHRMCNFIRSKHHYKCDVRVSETGDA